MRPLALIVARSENGCIGREGGMPWHFSEDLKYFKKTTAGHAVIMGRKTYESIGRPLPKRQNIIVTRDANYFAEGCTVCDSLESALTQAYAVDDAPFVIGGGELYRLALPRATQLYITEIARTVQGDTFFPEVPTDDFERTESVPGEDPSLRFDVWRRRS